MTRIQKLNFQPILGLYSKDLQTIISAYLPPSDAPPSRSWIVSLNSDDQLSCQVSIPSTWQEGHRTIALVHGLGGSHASGYMIRLSRKLYLLGYKVVRINLRGCGTGKGLSKLPYHGGNSTDILNVLQALKSEAPHSDVHLIGFSLGGNIVLKLAGELGTDADQFVKAFISVCAPIDLKQSVRLIEMKRNTLYQSFFLRKLAEQASPWIHQKLNTLYEYDNTVTAPLWGYKSADDYYQNCSSLNFLPKIQQTAHILFSEDDPFIPWEMLKSVSLTNQVNLWAAERGGHMGFLGKTSNSLDFYWLDQTLIKWITGDFTSELNLKETKNDTDG